MRDRITFKAYDKRRALVLEEKIKTLEAKLSEYT